MNIVYGVSGEGLGHVFEAIEIVTLLQGDRHTVKVLTYGDRACRSLAAFQPTRIVTYGAAEYIVKSFSRRERGTSHVHFVSPIIQGEIRRLHPTNGSHVLVYMTKPNPDLIEVLKSMNETFVVYCNNRVGKDHNIIHRAQGPDYLGDLGGCKAIIGTTGFSLIADSIYLKKPYYGVPLKKQFEQTHNAHFLGSSGLGEFSETVSQEKLERFLARLPDYREKLAKYDLDPAEQEETLRELLAQFERKSAAALRAGVTATFFGP